MLLLLSSLAACDDARRVPTGPAVGRDAAGARYADGGTPSADAEALDGALSLDGGLDAGGPAADAQAGDASGRLDVGGLDAAGLDASASPDAAGAGDAGVTV